ncbi:hypothetical protein BHM03_00001985 [Ensete ventricosum]|nr:hypothetical protein BHM03_00001985 [Ensete ventricosum]
MEEGSGGMEQETTIGRVQFIADRNQDSWQRKIVAGCDLDRLQRKIAAGSFLTQKITTGCDQGGWQREVIVGNIVHLGLQFYGVLATIQYGFKAVIAVDKG